MTKQKTFLAIAALTVAGLTMAAFTLRGNGAERVTYEFAQVDRGTLESVVSATGTLSAVETVEVGTQVSGVVAEVYVNYNDPVRRGQLLAVIEPDQLDAAVRDAQANLARLQAQYDQARAELDRNQPLYERGFLSEREFLPLQTSVRTAEASLQSAQAALDRAHKSRRDAEIRSPIDGVVIERAVEVGQTVAASLSAPVLFLIAEDLGHMQIMAKVDESDVGQIQAGQPVRFTVAAHPQAQFTGLTREIRLQPETVQNVVNYTVVVEAPNERGLLLPGMTATVDFVVQQVEDALLVPTMALNVPPTEEMRAVLAAMGAGETMRQRGERGREHGGASHRPAEASGADRQPGEAARQRGGGTGRVQGDVVATSADERRGFRAEEGGSGPIRQLWIRDAVGALQPVAVRLGATDGFTTQVFPLSGSLAVGDDVVVRVVGATSQQATPQQRSALQGGRGGLPGGGMQGGRGMRF